ncbi:MAG TPA: 4-hydroxy-3-methylbut-2-en-1-yl diphosphate synthase, partial [Planctomycetaceae bacterium]|nr:4-hydroxy-3-methylbut-2-en-1-yl diphosphate synthase [Planctomycetaceae bacterium]
AEPSVPWREKVERLADIAAAHDCALRIGVNCGSLDPLRREADDPMFLSALEHAEFLDSIGFTQYCVSLKESDPAAVLAVNRRFARERPGVPLHLGVTEAGMPPEGIMKSRSALEPLLAEGIGDTLRVSLTVPNDRKTEEIDAARLILENVERKTILRPGEWNPGRLNIISCPSCARVQNGAFVELAENLREATRPVAEALTARPDQRTITIAVMGCRVNGPGETDDADLGLWCGPHEVNLKRDGVLLGTFSYEDIQPRLLRELHEIVQLSVKSSKNEC